MFFLMSAVQAAQVTLPAQRWGLRFERSTAQDEFVAHGPGYRVELTAKALRLSLDGRAGRAPEWLTTEFTHANPRTELLAEQVLPGFTNYFSGQDPQRWRREVPAYRRVRYRNLYPGIDLVFYGAPDSLEYDFIVHPGANPAAIELTLSGAQNPRVDASGELVLATRAGNVRWKRPAVYQLSPQGERTAVLGRFAIRRHNAVRFELGEYDRQRDLIIDPVLSYATYLGGSSNDAAHAIAIDGQGNVFVAGGTTSQNLPVQRALQPGYNGGSVSLLSGDAFIAKFDPNGALLYLTYLGGLGDDYAFGLAVDAAGNAWVAGGTNSKEFPVTPNAFQPAAAGTGGNGLLQMGDAFLAKINSTGNTLLYSTYLGGKLDDYASAVALDSAGNVYVTGSTRSQDFPVAGSPLQAKFAGAGGEQVFPRYGVVPFDAGDVFVAKFNPAGTQLLYSTYLGGGLDDLATSIAVDSSGNAYVAGNTLSRDFPTTTAAFQRTNKGSDLTNNIFWNFGDAFVAKLNPSGSSLLYSTYLGGACDDFISSLAVDSAGNAYVAGGTCSRDFPVTTGVVQNSMRGPFSAPVADQLFGDGFVTKLNPAGSALVFSTFLGGTGDDSALALQIDSAGRVYVAGFTNSFDFPITSDAAQRSFAGGGLQNEHQNFGDIFLAQLAADGSKLLYSTYFGGKYDDVAAGLALDTNGNVYLTGSTVSTDFPVTSGALQKTFAGQGGRARFRGDSHFVKWSGFTPSLPPGPALSALQNAASYATGTVAPGSIFILYGTGIGPAELTGPTFTSGVLSNIVSGVQVLFDGVPAPLVYVSGTQISGVVPYSVAAKSSTQIVAVYQGQRSTAITARVSDALPGLFSANFSGSGQGAIYNQDASVNSAANPAKRGDIVVLYGTGEGQTDPPGTDGLVAISVFPKPQLPVRVTIGGQNTEVLYAGAVPFVIAGVFQINARVPIGIGTGNQPVVVLIGSGQSQPNLTVAVQ